MINTSSARHALLFGLVCLVVLAGCAKKPVDSEVSSKSIKPEGYMLDTDRQGQQGDDGFSAGELESLDKGGVNPLSADTSSAEYRATYGRSTAPLYPVFFAFDSSAINVDELENLNQSGTYLVETSEPVRLEGNCDARGTAEYNMALGELRALNVKKYLVNLGVEPGRITSISYGSQRPLYPGSDEASWAMNRRVDLVLPNQ